MIYDQLRNHCDCIKEEITDADIDELISLISMYTCWQQKPCETFLSGERKQVVDLPDCVDDCSVFEFEPFYEPFDISSFTFTLVSQTGTDETSTVLSDVTYSEVDEVFKMNLPIPDCMCKPKCGCPTHYKLLVTYVAGYDEIPECLLPLFCEALQYIKERKQCDCEECQTCTNEYGEQTQRLVYDAAKLTEALKVFFINMLSMQYSRQLSLISLCDKRKSELWGFRV